MLDLNELGKRSQAASKELAKLSQEKKNTAILNAAVALVENSEYIIKENAKDVKNAEERGVSPAMIDRLRVDESRIKGMAEGLEQVCALADPIGEVTGMTRRPNGLLIGSQRVPLGVIGMIYESRPNVTADAFGLCFKTGNSVILKGGSDAINSNIAITKVIREALEKSGVTPDAVILIEDTSREAATGLMRLNEYLDVLIPRGGYGLIKTVVENSTVPVIETGTGNCHIFVDETADLEMAVKIIVNAKTQRMGVCNACESLVVHKNIAQKAIPMICDALRAKNVEIRGCQNSCKLDSRIVPANDEDWGTEYLDAIISVKTVDGLDEAIEHINCYNTGHSEAIITSDYASSQRFINEIDAAAVYVNASTRFTDGFEFGYGAEIGISTQKLHARGPMGLLALTTTKNIIYGSGQIRE